MLSCNTHTQKRIALRYGTFHKASEIQANFMEVGCDNTGNRGIFYKLIGSQRAESSSKSGRCIFCSAVGPDFETTALIQVAGCRRQPLQGKSLQFLSQDWTPLSNYSSSGETLILDSSPGKGGEWSNKALQP